MPPAKVRERAHPIRGWTDVLAAAAPGAGARSGGLALALAAAVFMALAAPFGTSGEALPERLGFWTLGVGGGLLVTGALEAGLRSRLPAVLGPGGRVLLLVAIVTPPAAVAMSALAALVHRRPIDWMLCVKTMPQIAMVGLVLAGLFALAEHARRPPPAKPEATDPTLGGLLPHRLAGARILALEAEDHYVRVHTERGAHLALATLQEAIASLGALDGERVHRSWWVARAAVESVTRGQGRATLRLSGGVSAPVSRRYAKILRSSGWY